VVLLTSGALHAMTAEDVVGKTAVAGGLCCFPRLTQADEPLALALAGRPSFVVHAMPQDAAGVARMRGAAEAKGMLGRSLYVEAGDASKLPLADRLVDLLVVTNLTDADLTPALRAAWVRVLAPRRGTALVGRARAAGAGLSADALKAWMKGLPLAKIVADESGLWAVLRTDLPAGSDPWSHRCHGPDNAQVSGDTTFKAPFLAQWWGMPRQESFWGMTVVSGNGRLFSIRASRRSREQVFLTARSLTSGVVLWQKVLRQSPDGKRVPHGGYIPSRSCAVVCGDTLCLIEKDTVVRLKAETGELRDRIPGPKPGGQIKWLASANGLLAVLAGEADVVQPISYQTVAANPVGRALAVYDGESRRELWRDTAAGDVDERMIAIRGERLYCVEQGVGVACRELRTGKEVWTSPDPDVISRFRTPVPRSIASLLVSQPVLLALEDAVLLRAQWAKQLVALSPQDGRVLWRKPALPWGGRCAQSFQRALTGVPVGSLWVGGRNAIELKTGKTVKGPRFASSGCGPTLATPGYLITCWGKVMTVPGGRYIRRADIKAPCDIGTVVSEGLMVSMPSQCACPYEVKGYRALASAGSIRPHTAPPWKQRLTVLDRAEPAALTVTDADWPTYRHDPRRSGASAASVGGKPKILWRWKPPGATAYRDVWKTNAGPRLAPDFQTTAPVAATGLVWFASHDGVIRCLRADSGKEVWTFPTGAMLFAPPTLWGGRLLAGGGDGRIYCLDASTGRLLWRFLAGPLDRRVFWFGHLVSTWPVVPGVVVQDGVAYAVAGYQKESGIHVYAMNPKTGQVLWETDDAGTNPWSGSGSGGQCAVADGRLWLTSSPSGFFDLKTGQWKSLGGFVFGCELGVLDKWMFQGGRRLSETQDTLDRPLGRSGFAALSSDPKPAQFKLTDTGTALPVWDADLAVMPPKALSGALTAVPMARLLPWLTEKFPSPTGQSIRSPSRSRAVDWAELKSWTTQPLLPAAVALGKDRLIVACRQGSSYRLVAFRRDDGAKDWSVDLPEQPVMNRLALDRDGRILVALCDGSMLCLGR
jgi:outer membrane protein assembly factor BamB